MPANNRYIGILPDVISYGNKIDPLVKSFLTATGITNTTIINALNVLVGSLRTTNLINKFGSTDSAFYPIVGGTAFTHSFNLINTSLFQLSFVGGWTQSSNGAKPNGTNAYATTGYNILNKISQNNCAVSVYSRDNVLTLNSVDIGNSLSSGDFYLSAYYFATSGALSNINNGSIRIFTSSGSQGLFMSNRIASTDRTIYKNGSVLNNYTLTSTTPINGNITFGGNGGISDFSSRQSALYTISKGFTDFEANQFYNIVQTFQTALGRQV